MEQIFQILNDLNIPYELQEHKVILYIPTGSHYAVAIKDIPEGFIVVAKSA